MSTSAADDGGLGRSDRLSRGVDALAHRIGTIATAVVVLVVAGWLLGPDTHDTLALIASIFGLIWVIAQVGHDRRDHLCVRCMEAMPADPGAAVARGRVWLWLRHRFTESPAWMAGYTGLMVLCLLPGWLRWRAIDWLWIVPMAAMAWLSFNHRRLRPWCPYCRDWDEHGDHEPTPDPAGTKTRGR